jgi:hypothetical protein
MRRLNNHPTCILFLVAFLVIPNPVLARWQLSSVAAAPPDPRFGAIETYDAPDAATEMGAGWTRIPFLWSRMQPDGTHQWLTPISDEALAREIAQGRQPVGLIITTPGWATDTAIGPGVPYGLYTGHGDPNNLWANFLRRLVTAYAGRIDHWILWNEPDVWDAAHPGYTWGGSVDDFLQLQRVGYLAIKEANPNASVIFSGTSYWWDAAYGRDLYFRRYLDALVKDLSAPGNDYYCDAIALHVYFQPDFVYSITALYHQLMREHGFDKPVWIVETNAAPSLDPQMPVPNGQFAITLEEQAAYMIQAFAMGIAGGAARVGVFKMIDTPTDLVANPEPFGIVRADGSRRPAFTSYQVAATYLAGFQKAQLEQLPELSMVTVTRARGTTTVIWARTQAPATAQIPAHASSALVIDMWGNRRTIYPSEGSYALSLPGASCTHGPPCIIGGAPFLIVEGTVDAAPAPQPEPSTGESLLPTLPSLTPTSPAPTRAAEYQVNLRPVEMKGARDVWHKRNLPGYQIELVTGPPFYLYRLNVLNEVVREARRSLDPLDLGLKDLEAPRAGAIFSTTMTTLYNKRALTPFTVTGLFQRVDDYYHSRPGSPACDTQVTIKLNGEWAFPQRIEERLAAGCGEKKEPAGVAVVAFATLTPTPTRVPDTATPTPTSAPATPVPPTETLPAPSALPPTKTVKPAAPASQADGSGDIALWIIPLAGLAVIGILMLQRNERDKRR